MSNYNYPPHRRADSPRKPSPEEMAELRRLAREGADALHSRATTVEQRHKPTPTEELAIARARADKEAK